MQWNSLREIWEYESSVPVWADWAGDNTKLPHMGWHMAGPNQYKPRKYSNTGQTLEMWLNSTGLDI